MPDASPTFSCAKLALHCSITDPFIHGSSEACTERQAGRGSRDKAGGGVWFDHLLVLIQQETREQGHANLWS
jgi:hypothetical protein